MAYKQHYIEYFIGNQLNKKRIRRWAEENQNLFPEYGFRNRQSDFPTSHFIANRLEQRFGFNRNENDLEVVLRNTDRHFIF
jgi:hypothetical protein